VDTAAWPTPELVNQVLATKTVWRQTTHAVPHTYRRVRTSRGEAPRFAAYPAALDQDKPRPPCMAGPISELE
jgi:hypothetical protein